MRQLIVLFALTYGSLFAYEQDIAKWQEVPRPESKYLGARMVWSYAANYSKHEWRVFLKGSKPMATLQDPRTRFQNETPDFVPEADHFKGGSPACLKVDDGWLVGFNRGEFGRALYWFSSDGKQHKLISAHQIVAFFKTADGILAIEGLAHLSISEGSIIKLDKSPLWSAQKLLDLPQAPCAGTLFKDGRLFLALSDSLAIFDPKNGLKHFAKDADWGGLYPNSVVLSDDEKKAYIGMRQFVAEYDFNSKKLQFLIPDSAFLNKLPKEREASIRTMYDSK